MPNFRLTAEEADGLAAYLLANGEEKPPVDGDVPAGDPAKGKQLVASSGCLNCHAIGNEQERGQGALARRVVQGRLGQGAGQGRRLPRRRTAVRVDGRAAGGGAWRSRRPTGRRSAGEPAGVRRAAGDGDAVHRLPHAGRQGVAAGDALDQEQKDLEGKFPPPSRPTAEAFAPDQRPPLLTWAGEKLRPEWMAAFIGGQVPYKPRPYLRARMPAFTARAVGLRPGAGRGARLPADERGVRQAGRRDGGGRAETGRQDAEPGVRVRPVPRGGRRSPRSPRSRPRPSTSPTPSERLRKDYYHRWVHNPLNGSTRTRRCRRSSGTTGRRRSRPCTTGTRGSSSRRSGSTC